MSMCVCAGLHVDVGLVFCCQVSVFMFRIARVFLDPAVLFWNRCRFYFGIDIGFMFELSSPAHKVIKPSIQKCNSPGLTRVELGVN